LVASKKMPSLQSGLAVKHGVRLRIVQLGSQPLVIAKGTVDIVEGVFKHLPLLSRFAQSANYFPKSLGKFGDPTPGEAPLHREDRLVFWPSRLARLNKGR